MIASSIGWKSRCWRRATPGPQVRLRVNGEDVVDPLLEFTFEAERYEAELARIEADPWWRPQG
ncbi:hypothetical protein ACH4E7_26910 [Kitasatospora sp. NPDC018058]|uniref:hypothetical protein n=1 Tax=Kitasatospora sp. NPDC018058 TaxID=3364025 RepID=UPI0037C00E7A